MTLSSFALNRLNKIRSRGPLSRFGTQFLIDAFAWVFALTFAVFLRYDFNTTQISWGWFALICVVTVLVQLFVGWAVFLYRGRHPYGSFAEVRALLYTVLLAALAVGLPLGLFGTYVQVPRSIFLIAAPIAFVLMGGA